MWVWGSGGLPKMFVHPLQFPSIQPRDQCKRRKINREGVSCSEIQSRSLCWHMPHIVKMYLVVDLATSTSTSNLNLDSRDVPQGFEKAQLAIPHSHDELNDRHPRISSPLVYPLFKSSSLMPCSTFRFPERQPARSRAQAVAPAGYRNREDTSNPHITSTSQTSTIEIQDSRLERWRFRIEDRE